MEFEQRVKAVNESAGGRVATKEPRTVLELYFGSRQEPRMDGKRLISIVRERGKSQRYR